MCSIYDWALMIILFQLFDKPWSVISKLTSVHWTAKFLWHAFQYHKKGQVEPDKSALQQGGDNTQERSVSKGKYLIF